MAAQPCVFTGVLVWRTVAAEGYATLLAGAEMNPAGADLHAFFAFKSLWYAQRFKGVEMWAAGRHSGSLFAQDLMNRDNCNKAFPTRVPPVVIRGQSWKSVLRDVDRSRDGR
jgi:hypothetical protein